MAPATLERLRCAAGAVAGARLLWRADAQRRSVALGAIRIAETERFRRRELHAELFGAVRFDRGWHDSTDEWLAPAALEVEPPMRLPFAWLRDWRARQAMNCVGAHFARGLRAGYLPCALAPHIGLIMTDATDDGLEDLRAGRAFQRLWLAAADEDLALQPMAAATALVRQTPGQGWVSPTTKARSRNRWPSSANGSANARRTCCFVSAEPIGPVPRPAGAGCTITSCDAARLRGGAARPQSQDSCSISAAMSGSKRPTSVHSCAATNAIEAGSSPRRNSCRRCAQAISHAMRAALFGSDSTSTVRADRRDAGFRRCAAGN